MAKKQVSKKQSAAQARLLAPAPTAEVRWLDADEQQAWRGYLRATMLVQERLDRDLQRFGVSLSEYEVLAMLSEAPERRLRMSVLADTVIQSRSRLTHTAGRMERQGWVTRLPVPHDRRGVELCLTDAGLQALERLACEHVDGVRAALVDVLGREDFLALGALMARVRDAAGPR